MPPAFILSQDQTLHHKIQARRQWRPARLSIGRERLFVCLSGISVWGHRYTLHCSIAKEPAKTPEDRGGDTAGKRREYLT